MSEACVSLSCVYVAYVIECLFSWAPAVISAILLTFQKQHEPSTSPNNTDFNEPLPVCVWLQCGISKQCHGHISLPVPREAIRGRQIGVGLRPVPFSLPRLCGCLPACLDRYTRSVALSAGTGMMHPTLPCGLLSKHRIHNRLWLNGIFEFLAFLSVSFWKLSTNRGVFYYQHLIMRNLATVLRIRWRRSLFPGKDRTSMD